jgi:hypothetical protein
MVRSLPEHATPEDIAALLEDIELKIKEKEELKNEKEEFKLQEIKRQRLIKV